MSFFSAHRRLAASIVATAPLASLALGSGVRATSDSPAPTHDDDGSHVVKAQVGTQLCQPIVGTGKVAGVPIAVEDRNGNLLTDLSGLTFELRRTGDGASEDVTGYIGTAAEQPAVADDFIAIDGVGNRWSATRWYQYISDETGKSGPSLSFDNPGYFFLGCTPDNSDPTVKFGEDIVLVALRDGAIVASGSPAGRGASLMYYQNWWTGTGNGRHDLSLWPLMGVTTIDDVYAAVTMPAATYATTLRTNTGLGFTPTFALLAILASQRDVTGSSTDLCWKSFVDSSGATWTLNATGTQVAAALVSGTNLASMSAELQEDHPAAYCDTEPYLPYVSQNLIHILATQLLLVDGPAGRVPSSISDTADYYRPAVLLESTLLPETGADTAAPLAAAILAITAGSVLVALPRRRRA